MIYHLLWYLRDVFTHRFGFYAYQNVMFRSVSAILTSLLIALLIGPKIIRWLMRKKIGDRPEFHHATLNELTKEKANTPTMGGLIIILSTISTTLLWAKLNNPFVQKAIVLVIWFGALGGVDDWLKLTLDVRHRTVVVVITVPISMRAHEDSRATCDVTTAIDIEGSGLATAECAQVGDNIFRSARKTARYDK